jgi:DNA uptake protein ComE-like DNA-binding protein
MNGKFQSLDDLKKVPNIEFKRIQLKKDAIRYE